MYHDFENVVRSWISHYWHEDYSSTFDLVISSLLCVGQQAVESQVSAFEACDLVAQTIQQTRPNLVVTLNSSAVECDCFFQLLWSHTELVNDIVVSYSICIIDNVAYSDLLLEKIAKVFAACFVMAPASTCVRSVIEQKHLLQASKTHETYFHLMTVLVGIFKRRGVGDDGGGVMAHLISAIGDATR